MQARPPLWVRAQSDEGKDIGFLVITHYPRILKHVAADVVHILIDGRIVKTGGPELADEIERDGYDGVREEVAFKATLDEFVVAKAPIV